MSLLTTDAAEEPQQILENLCMARVTPMYIYVRLIPVYCVDIMHGSERRRRAKEINSKGYRNQELANTFDSVVSTTLDVVKVRFTAIPIRHAVDHRLTQPSIRKPNTQSPSVYDDGRVRRTCYVIR